MAFITILATAIGYLIGMAISAFIPTLLCWWIITDLVGLVALTFWQWYGIWIVILYCLGIIANHFKKNN